MKIIKATFLASMLLALGGCMVVPVAPAAHGYYAPGFYGPTIGIGVYGRGDGRGYGRGHWRD